MAGHDDVTLAAILQRGALAQSPAGAPHRGPSTLASILQGPRTSETPEDPAHHSNYQPRKDGKFKKGKPEYPDEKP